MNADLPIGSGPTHVMVALGEALAALDRGFPQPGSFGFPISSAPPSAGPENYNFVESPVIKKLHAIAHQYNKVSSAVREPLAVTIVKASLRDIQDMNFKVPHVIDTALNNLRIMQGVTTPPLSSTLTLLESKLRELAELKKKKDRTR